MINMEKLFSYERLNFDAMNDQIMNLSRKKQFESKYEKMDEMLKSAQRKVEAEHMDAPAGAALDKQVVKRIKFGLHRFEFLANELATYHRQGKPVDNKLERLTTDVYRDMPDFASEEGGVYQIEAFDYRQEGLREILKLLVPDDDEEFAPAVSAVPIIGIPSTGTGKTSFLGFVYDEISKVRDHPTFDKVVKVDISNVHTPEDLFSRFYYQVWEYRDVEYEGDYFQLSSFFRYLIILDGSFEEDPDKWYEWLEPLLPCFGYPHRWGINKIIFSTSDLKPRRSFDYNGLPIAKGAPYLMESLRYQHLLFQSIAFRGILEERHRHPLVGIANSIFNLCYPDKDVITTVASLLSSYHTDLPRWQNFYHLLRKDKNFTQSIQSLLHLIRLHSEDFRFRDTLHYTSLFPINYLFDKAELYQLWEVQGLVNHGPLQEESIDTIFEKLVSIGFFFNSTRRDKTSSVVPCIKANSLMHEVVKYLARDDFRLVDKPTVEDADLQHASFMVDSSWKAPFWLHGDTRQVIKSLIFFPINPCSILTVSNINKILANLKALQVLDLATVNCRSFLNAICELKHLRYLKLGACSELLPNCIINLPFLQTLDLRHSRIRELPTDFHRLSSLRHLFTGDTLIGMPPEFERLQRLQTLDVFTVGRNNSLDTLNYLKHLVGKLKVCYRKDHNSASVPLIELVNLDDLTLAWPSYLGETDANVVEYEFLPPPLTLKCLGVEGWKGISFPQRVMDLFPTKLKNLVSIYIANCNMCRNLPSFSTLQSLESLQLLDLKSLEWIEITDGGDSQASSSEFKYFPSLKYLMLANLPQLKGWSKVEEQHEKHDVPEQAFKCLSELRVSNCPKLVSMPMTPSLEHLMASNILGKLLKHFLNTQNSPELPSSSASPSASSSTLKELHINCVNELESLSINISSLEVLTIRGCKDLVTVLADSSSSLKRLEICGCIKLEDISQALFHCQSSVKDIEIEGCEVLNLGDVMPVVDDGSGAALHGHKNLFSLTLTNISESEHLLRGRLNCFATIKMLSLNWFYNLRVLPESIGQLTQLRWLVIRYFPNLESLPKSLVHLSALESIEIRCCPRLEHLPNFHEHIQRVEVDGEELALSHVIVHT